MPKTRQQKEETLKSIVAELKQASSVIFVGYHGLSVAVLEKLRKELREAGAELEIIKKTILQKALAETDLPALNVKELGGGLAVLVGRGDEVAPAKVLAGFTKQNEIMMIYGGIMEKRFLSSAEIMAFAKLLGKNELLAKLVGCLNAPLAGLVNTLAGSLRGLINVLKARSESI